MKQHKNATARAERVNLQILISYDANENQVTRFCSNLSESGLFIETIDPLPVGTELRLRFSLPIERKEFSLLSRVVWIKKAENSGEKTGMGLEFGKLDKETVDLLERAVSYLRQILGDR